MQPKRIGILGGGQLGQMLTQAAHPLGFTVTILDATPDSPAHQVGATQIVGTVTDEIKITELATQSDFLTWDIEHINTNILQKLEDLGHSINPSPKTLEHIKDKLAQKKFLQKNNIPTAPFLEVHSTDDMQKAIEKLGLPVVLKTRFGGYDGRGNYVLKNKVDIEKAYETLGKENLYVEGFVTFTKELAVMAARDMQGNISLFPIVQTQHTDNILQTVLAPAPIATEQIKQAEDFAKQVMQHLDGAGVFGIEMFLAKSGEILVNEIAPRVHNSGHYTIEACETSQFTQHIRAITDMKLGPTNMTIPAAVMINILGTQTHLADPQGIEEARSLGNVFVHIYGKKETRPQRKMGHITVLGQTMEEALVKAEKARKLISI